MLCDEQVDVPPRELHGIRQVPDRHEGEDSHHPNALRPEREHELDWPDGVFDAICFLVVLRLFSFCGQRALMNPFVGCTTVNAHDPPSMMTFPAAAPARARRGARRKRDAG